MNWIEQHREIWAAKPALRHYYENEIFDRIVSRMPKGRCLEIGTGPGFFSGYSGNVVSIDVEFDRKQSACADVHQLPFRSGSFEAVVGIDVLHHLRAPATALGEIARVLKLGGSLVLVEPWAGPFGGKFYRYIHHEDCRPVDDPFCVAFPDPKNPMQGNAWIPKAILVDCQNELQRRVPGLQVREIEIFGAASFLLTGGFSRVGLSWPVISGFLRVERLLPAAVLKFLSLRVMFVLKRVEIATPRQ